ncbi:MAG: DUF4253 domain-containing protein [Lawsonibacter sp.]|nr:DUF4253 domain-containing protein [Lawsonibacter sp.]
MRENPTIEEQVEQLKEYLGCPCTYFPSAKDDSSIMEAYYQAQARGKQEGFVPMLVAVDELLLECFELNGEDKSAEQARQELLSAPLESGEEFLQQWLREIKEDLEEDEPGYWEQLMGEVSDGEGIDCFLSLRDFNGKKTVPVVLAEIPVKNPWEVFAYLPFGGWNECPTNEEHMAVAKYWFEKYGAVPALMTHDVLEYGLPTVYGIPREQALDLALEQYAYCNDIVDQGVETIGRLADGLSKSFYWYFWWD